MRTLEEAIERFSGCCMFVTNQKETCEQLAEWLRELQERRKEPKIITCGECDYREIRGVDGFCDHITGEPIMVKKTDHCSWAERKVDG